jgi:hypothetical protein
MEALRVASRLSILDTAAGETPASAAMSLIVAMMPPAKLVMYLLKSVSFYHNCIYFVDTYNEFSAVFSQVFLPFFSFTKVNEKLY